MSSLAQNHGCVFIAPYKNSYLLTHSATGECRRIDRCTRYHNDYIMFTPQGFGYYQRDGQTIWVSTTLNFEVHRGAEDDDGFLIARDSKERIDIRNLFDRSAVFTLAIRIGSAGHPHTLKVGRYEFSKIGSRLMWSVEDLYEACGLEWPGESSSTSKSIGRGLERWQTFAVVKVGLDPSHVRNSRPYIHPNNLLDVDLAALRQFKFHSMSSAAMLAVIVKWLGLAQQAGGLSREDLKLGVVDVAEGILNGHLEKDANFNCFLDPSWDPPRPPTGRLEMQ